MGLSPHVDTPSLEAMQEDREGKEVQEVLEVPNDDWKTLPDDIQCIKIGIDAMFSMFTFVSYSHLLIGLKANSVGN